MSYVERISGPGVLACTWEQTAIVPRSQLVVPDACVDLIWSGERLTLAGPDTHARVVELACGARLVGARLRPGAAGAVLAVPVSALRDLSADAAAVLGHDSAARLLEQLHDGSDPHSVLARALHALGRQRSDPLLGAAVSALGRPRARVDAVARELNLSARQLQRRVSDAVGYGPKMLQRVLRFRRLQLLAPAPLAELALDAGYCDQAHMTAEVTRLTGMPPVRFLKDHSPTAA